MSTDAGDHGNTTGVTQDVPGRKSTKHTVGGGAGAGEKSAQQDPGDVGKTSGHSDKQVSPGHQDINKVYLYKCVCKFQPPTSKQILFVPLHAGH